MGVRERPPIKCKDRVLEYLREKNVGEVWRVDAERVTGRLTIKCKERVLEYLSERRDGEIWRVHAVDLRGIPPKNVITEFWNT